MTTLDVLVLAVTSISLLSGLMKGFVRSIWGLLTAFVGLFLAATLHTHFMPLVRGWVESDTTALLTAFLLIFVFTLFVGSTLGRSLRRFLEKTRLSWIDHLAGGAFGLLRGWLVCSVIYVGLTAFPVQPDVVAEATLAPYLLQGAEVLTYVTSKELRDQFLDEYHRLQDKWNGKPVSKPK